jgi:ectoine hydroxylase-related dioxygenase (phytanoyl-CoA dioxygenase family)
MISTADALAALARDGYVILERAITAAELERVRAGLAPALAAGKTGRNDFEGTATRRVYALLAKVPETAVLVEHPSILAIVDRLLLPSYLLTAHQAIQIAPGESPQPWHFDDGFYPIPRPRPSVSISTIWAIDDFTADNGATEIVPGSHLWPDGVSPESAGAPTMPVVMPAGSVVVFQGTLWHRGGANTSERPRCAVSPQYCQPWARQQENMMLAVGERARDLSPRVRALLGYSIHPPFMGFIDGAHPLRLIDRDYRADESGARDVAKDYLSGDHPSGFVRR